MLKKQKLLLALWLVVSAELNFHIFFKPNHVTNTVVADVQNTVVAEVQNTVVAEVQNTVVAEVKNTVLASAKTTVVAQSKTKVVEEAKAIVIGNHTVLHMPALPAATEPLVLLGFPFLHELDLLHI